MRKKNHYYFIIILFLSLFVGLTKGKTLFAENKTESDTTELTNKVETAIVGKSIKKSSIFSHLSSSGWVVSGVLLLLILLSIFSWALCIGKLYYLSKIKNDNRLFIEKFWKENSLKDLSSSLSKFSYSPAREVFRESYKEFQRNNSLHNKTLNLDVLLGFTTNSLSCVIQNTKRNERKKLELYLPFLAITASTAPFIGLFGTVWGIMNSFEAIALTGNASLGSVAPGLSEALIATAFGLGAAIPSAIGYSLAGHKIRNLFSELENFSQSFINIIEKHLISSRQNSESSQRAEAEKV